MDRGREVCRFYLRGSCRYGARCRFQHPAKGQKKGRGSGSGGGGGGGGGRSRNGMAVDGSWPRHGGMAVDGGFAKPQQVAHWGGAPAAAADVVVYSPRKRKTYESFADERVDAEDYNRTVCAEIKFDAGSMEQLTKLFNRLDVNQDGFLTREDFATLRSIKLWTDLRIQFDENGDGKVSLTEFRNGFKRYVLKQAANLFKLPDPTTPLKTWLDALAAAINVQAKEICGQVFKAYVDALT